MDDEAWVCERYGDELVGLYVPKTSASGPQGPGDLEARGSQPARGPVP